ncbi:MAG: DUF4890 domain-containing protein [Candidatus Thiodiazotropha sp. (ex Monitilora ramsayi)]|nr:DUF4890 domain-containing protein [Candidatus Thiodiazotropha sp. (ex Monitilora ramsayi)]
MKIVNLNSAYSILIMGLGAMLLLSISVISLANDGPQRDVTELSQMATEQMADELSLNDEQLKQAENINLKFFERLQSMRQDGKSQRIARLRELKQATRERDDAMQEILSEQQYAAYMQMTAERRSELRELIKARRQVQ